MKGVRYSKSNRQLEEAVTINGLSGRTFYRLARMS